MARIASSPVARLLLAAHGALAGLTVDVENADSVKAAAALVAEDLMTLYHGNETGQTPGIFDSPPAGDYWWWTGSTLWSSLLGYRNRTGDTKYDETISQGLMFQVGPNNDYMPLNWTASEGNDDQGLWALSAMAAGLYGLPNGGNNNPQWVDVAKSVFDEQHMHDRRVDEDDCAGALRWQIYPFNKGYDYVNSASNIAFLNLAAQLAYVTGNKTYADAASDTFDLLSDIGLVTEDFDVYDGAQADDCDVNKAQFSYDAGLLIQGAAFMYNHTGEDGWRGRLDGLVNRTLDKFFVDGAAFEVACEESNRCNTDMYFLKGILLRTLGSAMQVAPHTADKILPVLKSSAKAAAAQCTGGDNGRMCGFKWASGKFDGKTGPAQQINVLEALVSVLPAGGATTGSNSNGTDSGSNGQNTQGSTTDDHQSMGVRSSVSVAALVGSALLGSLFM
ncbi:glycoside hydrolase family 76 protein [Hypoxylon trugodes]|uniref:glycoside hydrolase family 76 protein n=1 Tax=Hypoxylon trugodes TaxID=326681 RepID=UPI0021987632|nr:glycoside hydrolase family 76 protein [Hypoxylon trugodes]KAI1386765.1 glycoside hydrolase family 76 protein [Hypoxylon trugodes]